MRTAILGILLSVVLLAGCGSSSDSSSSSAATATGEATTATAPSGGERFPDVKDVKLKPSSGGVYTVDVTISSPYDSPQRYADGWRVLAAGTDRVLGMHTLGHDHADEQPFARTQDGLKIPSGIEKVTVEGRDRKNGYGGATVTVAVPSS